MPWENTSIRLSCGCTVYGDFEVLKPNDEAWCDAHEEQTITRVSRIMEASGSSGKKKRESGVRRRVVKAPARKRVEVTE